MAAVLSVPACSKDPIEPTPTPIDPPRIACPAPVTLVSPLGLPTAVVYGSASVTNGAPPVTTSCTPASGSQFPVGASQVTCTATDAQRRTSSCSFAVRVQQPAQISMTRFVAFGDSITKGEDGNYPIALSAERLTSGAPLTLEEAFASPAQFLLGQEYPTVLQQTLAGRYTLQTIVVHNEGLPAERAVEAISTGRFSTVLTSRLPQAVLIMEGTNDIFYGDPTAIPPAIAALRTMITTARARGVRPYLATVPPMNPNGFRGRQGYATVPTLNAQIAGLAQSEAVTLVDVHAAFNGNLTLISTDGLHPNAAGFELIGQTFYNALRNTLEVAPPALAPSEADPLSAR